MAGKGLSTLIVCIGVCNKDKVSSALFTCANMNCLRIHRSLFNLKKFIGTSDGKKQPLGSD